MTYATGIAVLGLATSLAAMSSVAAQNPKHETQAQLMREAKVTKVAATKTAIAQVPHGRIRSSEIERENGKLIYSFDIKVPHKSGIEEINVDAMTGEVIAHQHETPKSERKEAMQEKNESRKK